MYNHAPTRINVKAKTNYKFSKKEKPRSAQGETSHSYNKIAALQSSARVCGQNLRFNALHIYLYTNKFCYIIYLFVTASLLWVSTTCTSLDQ